MTFVLNFKCICIWTLSLFCFQTTFAFVEDAHPRIPESVKGVLNKFCISCHGNKKTKADLNLEMLSKIKPDFDNLKTWQNILEQLQTEEMPPDDEAMPSAALREKAVLELKEWIKALIGTSSDDPGPFILKRLNRYQYHYTINDVFDQPFDLLEELPTDALTYGFDHIGKSLKFSSTLMERYMKLSEKIVGKVIEVPTYVEPIELKTHAGKLSLNGKKNGRPIKGRGYFFWSNGTVSFPSDLVLSGRYKISVELIPDQAGDEPAVCTIYWGKKIIHKIKTHKKSNAKKKYTATINIPGGYKKLSLGFSNDYYNKEAKHQKQKDRNLGIEGITLKGPLNIEESPFSLKHQKLLGASFKKADVQWELEFASKKAKLFFERMALKLFRRPLSNKESTTYLNYFSSKYKESAQAYESILSSILKSMLVSPSFLIRYEQTPKSSVIEPCDDYELASRLSYFLWSSCPDEYLLYLAENKLLSQAHILKSEIKRMMMDAKFSRFLESFFGQWWNIRSFESQLSKETDPTIVSLKSSMITETKLFIAAWADRDLPFMDLYKAKWSMINKELHANYLYEGENKNSAYFQKVNLSKSKRFTSGFLTMPFFLTMTSHATTTSPVRRGRFILEEVLGHHVPPAPPLVPPLVEAHPEKPKSFRKRLEQHLSDPACRSCHKVMDPIGFAYENFDELGRWRTEREGKLIDASGRIKGVGSFSTVDELLNQLLDKHEKDCVMQMIKKLSIYAYGRGLMPSDVLPLQKIFETAKDNRFRLSDLIISVVNSAPFRTKKLNLNNHDEP